MAVREVLFQYKNNLSNGRKTVPAAPGSRLSQPAPLWECHLLYVSFSYIGALVGAIHDRPGTNAAFFL